MSMICVLKGYDAMSDELKQLIEDTTYDLNHSADKRLEVINTMLDKEVGSYIQAFNKINSVISNTGFVGSTDFNNAQSQMSSQSGASTTKNNATQSQSSSNNKPSSAASGTNTTLDNFISLYDYKNYTDKNLNFLLKLNGKGLFKNFL